MGIIEEEDVSPFKHGLATFSAFAVAGLLPLFSYLLPIVPDEFLVSVVVTGISLAIVGALRTLISLKTWWQGALEMLLVGGVAAVAAYLLGDFLKNVVS